MGTKYFYARVSSVQQNEARQLDAARECEVGDANVFVDKESGKDFCRTNWLKLVDVLKTGDVLFILSLDRLGRNYKEILRVWQELTKDKGVDVVVLDMPLLDTRRCKDLLGTFISDVVLQVLSFVAQSERERIHERQRQGIEAAKRRGKIFGRPRRELPNSFNYYANAALCGACSQVFAAASVGVPLSTFRNMLSRYKQTVVKECNKSEIKSGKKAAQRVKEKSE